ncbi:ribosomal protein S12 methylthiotransferase accessory factor [Nocardiopsis sp. Huas11]|uniref:YcaO-like family protein n=1 Tax=Nocardiopsis sp. Huas11 TaxID=2183912 RepID=UPI000EAD46BD|nr:YcaO-like family protein [Nocardiopsis sp. Huas11]RKS09261.1 ribosomal protein S12 methylthiotransferase accessory factor [Nocardiopsis sp. Huas11]
MTALDALSGRFVSLAGRLAASRHHPDEPAVGQVFCKDATHAQALGSAKSWYCGAGRDISADVAAKAALGEAFERYGLRDLDDTRTRTASAAVLAARGTRHIRPAEVAPVDDPGVASGPVPLGPPPPDDVEIRWIASVDLVTGEEVLVPAQYCIFFEHFCGDAACPTCAGRPSEDAWCIATSSGTAAGTSPAAACLSGLLELMERDAFMLMWYHQLRFPYLGVDPYSRLGQRIRGLFGAPRIDVRFIDLTRVHDVPVVVAVARGRLHDREVYAIGGGSALDLESAVWKAARESAGLYALARRDVAAGVAPLGAEEVVHLSDHLRYYTNQAHHHELAFLFEERESSPAPVRSETPPRPPADELRGLTSRLGERGIRTCAVDLMPADMPLDLFSYKVVSPELIPLDAHHKYRHLNRERLLDEPARRGWRPDRPALGRLNHVPHPFP